MVSLLYLKHAFNLSDQELVQPWSENVYWQHFSGMAYFDSKLPCDATQIGRFRRVLGEAGVEQLLKTTIEAAVAMNVVKKTDFERVIVDSTGAGEGDRAPGGQPAAGDRAAQVVSAARRCGLLLKQTFVKEGKELRSKAGGYAHAKQFKRLRRTVERQRTILGVVIRDAQRKLDALMQGKAQGGDRAISPLSVAGLKTWLDRAERIRSQQRHDKNKLYSLHAPEVECISKGKARKPYEFGVKVSLAVTHGVDSSPPRRQGPVVHSATPLPGSASGRCPTVRRCS